VIVGEGIAMLSERLPWMYRSHEDYDPNVIGAISQAKIATALLEAGMYLLLPCMRELRYDMVIEDAEGRFLRVQCKTAQLHGGAIWFRPQSLRAAKRGTNWRRIAAGYEGEIDCFGVYCPDNGKVYLVPIADVIGHSGCFLRIDPPKNNQQKGIRWAKDYEVKPLSITRNLMS
jgi:PD-(D/E)XK endonuclease